MNKWTNECISKCINIKLLLQKSPYTYATHRDFTFESRGRKSMRTSGKETRANIDFLYRSRCVCWATESESAFRQTAPHFSPSSSPPRVQQHRAKTKRGKEEEEEEEEEEKKKKKKVKLGRGGLLQHCETISARISPEEYHGRLQENSARIFPLSSLCFERSRLACSAFSKARERFKRRVASRRKTRETLAKVHGQTGRIRERCQTFRFRCKEEASSVEKRFLFATGFVPFCLSPLLLATGHSDCEER